MLSNTAIQRYCADHPQHQLLADGTFFRYLLQRALPQEGQIAPTAVSAWNRNAWQLTSFYLEALAELAPLRILDVEVGLGRWALLIREYGEDTDSTCESWRCDIEGIAPTSITPSDHLGSLYNRIYHEDPAVFLDHTRDHWDLVILELKLHEDSGEAARHLLDRALDVADYVLVGASLQECATMSHKPDNTRRYPVDELLAFNPIRYVLKDEAQCQGQAALLVSRADPKGLRTGTRIDRFSPIFFVRIHT